MRRAILVLGLTALPTVVRAHVMGSADRPGWTFDPWLVAPLVISLVLYGLGVVRLAKRSGPGRATLIRQGGLFAAGWLSLAVAVVSPLHQAGERSFALHMIEHEVLMLVSAPLLVLSRPLGAMVWALPEAGRKRLGSLSRQGWIAGPFAALSTPITATLVQAAVLWLWHAPALFDLALSQPGWHIAQHLSFLISALFFWQAMLGQRRGSHALGLCAICLFATSLVAGALGALMAFSASPWYSAYALLGMTPSGLTPTEDQQLAGLLMWIPGGLVHAGAALALIGQTLSLTSPPGARLSIETD